MHDFLKFNRDLFNERNGKKKTVKLSDVQARFRRGRGITDQIDNICWIIEKAREFQKNIYFCFIDYAKAFVYMTINCGKF